MSEPLPQRIGDAERDRAAEYLRDHLAAGRLDQVEFDDRLSQALTARTADDLEPLFDDLPGPKPGDELAPLTGSATPVPAEPPRSARSQLAFVATILAAVAWPAVIITFFVTGAWGSLWFLWFLPIFVSSWAGKLNGDDRGRHGPHHHNRQIEK